MLADFERSPQLFLKDICCNSLLYRTERVVKYLSTNHLSQILHTKLLWAVLMTTSLLKVFRFDAV